jgi:hypothetical protein
MYLNFRFHPGRGREIQGGGGTRTCESWFWSLNNNQHKESIQATAEPAERLIPTFSSRSFCVAGLVNHWWREQRNGKTVVLCRYELVQGTKDILDVMIFFFYHWHLLAPNTSRRQGQKNQGPQKKITASSLLKKQIKLSRALYTNKPSSKSNPMHVTMPSQSFAVPHTMSSILSTSPQHRVLSSRDGNHQRPHHVELSSCQESYMLFKRCSMSDKTEGYSCSDAVASYMRCALNDCH